MTAPTADSMRCAIGGDADLADVSPRFPLDRIGAWLSAVIHSSLDGVIVMTPESRIMLANREAARLFGRPAAHLVEQPFETLLDDPMQAEYRRQLAAMAAIKTGGRRLRIKLDMQAVRQNGERFLVSAAVSRVSVRGESFLVLILHELVQRPGVPSQSESARISLRQLALSAQQAAETEKRRFSKELYDELCQRLSVLKLDLEWLERRRPEDAGIPDRIAQMQGLLDNIISRAKDIASSLRPALLDDFGLLPAAEWMAESFEKKTGVGCELINEGTPIALAEPIESAIFRILQESLLNIERHARASHVVIHLWHTDGHFHVRVTDNGIGLSESSRGKPCCYGLTAMHERIYALGGRLEIGNNPERGMSVHAAIPFQSENPL